MISLLRSPPTSQFNIYHLKLNKIYSGGALSQPIGMAYTSYSLSVRYFMSLPTPAALKAWEATLNHPGLLHAFPAVTGQRIFNLKKFLQSYKLFYDGENNSEGSMSSSTSTTKLYALLSNPCPTDPRPLCSSYANSWS